MLVYGDRGREEDPQEKLAAIVAALKQVASLPPGIARHGTLVTAFVEAGALAQGIADAEADERGRDAPSPAQDAAMALLMDLAGSVWASWTSGFADVLALPLDSIASLHSMALPASIVTKPAEGFAFYALYPESYAAAAVASPLTKEAAIIGLRSIGAPLAAMVATALGAPAPVTARPTGHVFHREIELSEEVLGGLLACPGSFAVVDEGPGLSGSSFIAVADALEGRDVPPERIVFFPSHAGPPGPEASERIRARWQAACRPFVALEDLVLRAERPEHRLEHWAADLVGRTDLPLQDISAGDWRGHRFASEAWPPAHAQQERRKFLLKSGEETWQLKFAGLGTIGERKLDAARELAAAGFTPPVAGLRHGFLIERWMDEARPLALSEVNADWLAAEVGRYLGFRARSFPAEAERGASLARLWEMARYNTEQALGLKTAQSLERWTEADIERLALRVQRIETDNRLHVWEWLLLPDGRLLKCDALDHHDAHDLVGSQDVAWDIAGATIELDLDASAQQILEATVERESGRAIDPELISFLTPCYLAFQLGFYTMAANAAPNDEERGRLADAVARYSDRLKRTLTSGFED